jgi:hypothetical protein
VKSMAACVGGRAGPPVAARDAALLSDGLETEGVTVEG